PSPRIVALPVPPPLTNSPPSLNAALTGSSISAPMSPASFSTRSTSPEATRYCFPPVSIIACIAIASCLGARTHGMCRNHWSKHLVYYKIGVWIKFGRAVRLTLRGRGSGKEQHDPEEDNRLRSRDLSLDR